MSQDYLYCEPHEMELHTEKSPDKSNQKMIIINDQNLMFDSQLFGEQTASGYLGKNNSRILPGDDKQIYVI